MTSITQERKRRELTVAEIEALEAIELPSREAMTGLTVSVGLCLRVDLNVNVNLGGGCSSTCS